MVNSVLKRKMKRQFFVTFGKLERMLTMEFFSPIVHEHHLYFLHQPSPSLSSTRQSPPPLPPLPLPLSHPHKQTRTTATAFTEF